MTTYEADALLDSQKKRHREGTHRLFPPEETLRRVLPFMAEAGITRVANVTNLDTVGIPVVNTYRPNSRSVSVSQGKGLTLAAAKASGVMEAMELYIAERPLLPLRRASHDELRRHHSVVDVWNLPRLATSSFRDTAPITWVEGVDLGNDRASRWVPFDVVHTDWTLPLVAGSEMFLMSSNGLASGNSFMEAASHAICELVERDATTLWYCSNLDRSQSRIARDTIDDESCLRVLDKFDQAGVAVGIWETTTDVGIASYHCMIAERDTTSLRRLPPTTGQGCHPAREIALARALNEAAQKRLNMITGARDYVQRSDYAQRLDAAYAARILDLICEAEGSRSFHDAPAMAHATIDDDVNWAVERLAAIGLREVVAIDLTPVNMPFSVVRVVIPGLEPMHDVEGYVPGPRARARLGDHAP